MRTDQKNYIPLDSTSPLRGLATSPPTTRLNPSLSPNCENVVVRDGVVRRRAGYLQLGSGLVGKVLRIVEFGALGANEVTVALTETRQYAFDTGAQDWVDLTEGQVSDPITAVTQGTPSFGVATDRTATFVDGLKFSVDGGPNQGSYTCDGNSTFGAGTTTIVVLEAIPSATDSDNIVTIDTDPLTVFTTADGNSVESVDLVDLDPVALVTRKRLLITNGSTYPKTWDGSLATTFERWIPDFDNLESVRSVAIFKDHLFLGGLVISGTQELQSIAWSNAGKFDDFKEGSSGIQLLHEASRALQHLEVLGDRLAVYSHDSIHLATFVGEPAIFAFEAVIPKGTRLSAATSVVSIDLGHVFVAEENFYLFDGSRGLLVLGEAIYNDYKGNKDHENLHLLASLNDYSKRTLFFSVPKLEGGSVSYTAVYNLARITDIAWSKEQYNDDVTAFGFHTNRYVYTWDDAPWEPAGMTWGEELGPWGTEGEQVEFPVRVLGASTGDVFLVTEGVFKDNGTDVEEVYETMDFVLPSYQSQLGRTIELEFEAWGTRVDVSYSLDKGQSYTTLVEDLALTSVPTYYKQPFDGTSRTVRIKFRSLENFALSQVRVWVNPGGPR